MRKTALGPLGLLLGTAVLGGWLLQDGVARDRNLYEQARVFQEVLDRVSREYVDEVPGDALYQDAVDGVLGALEDPHSYVFEPEGWEQFRIQTDGGYAGVGLEITFRSGFVTVIAPIPGGPAAARGIQAGDQIVGVEGQSADGWEVDEMAEALRGEVGTAVSIELRRPGLDQTFTVQIERAEVDLPGVPFVKVLGDDVGYVPVQLFRQSVAQEVSSALDSLRESGIERVVLDLRGNPGGLLEEGIAMADLFLPAGASIVETQNRSEIEAFLASDPDRYEGLALVVLVDDGSASASEIVAGALQDHDRALLVGTRTFGKGSVQTLYPLSGGQVLKLTTARWLTPSGRSIEADDETHPELEEGAVWSLDGRMRDRSSIEGRPTFQSFGCETLYGGGGITPNHIVLPDTLTEAERRTLRRIRAAMPDFYTRLFDFAVAFLQETPTLADVSDLGPEIVSAFGAALESAGVGIDADLLGGATRPLHYQIGREIALQRWGIEGEFEWTSRFDPQLDRALELARSERPGAEALCPQR